MKKYRLLIKIKSELPNGSHDYFIVVVAHDREDAISKAWKSLILRTDIIVLEEIDDSLVTPTGGFEAKCIK